MEVNAINKRKVLNGAHKLIRFTEMKLQDFQNVFYAIPEFFEVNEVGEILAAIVIKSKNNSLNTSTRYKPVYLFFSHIKFI